MTAREEIRLKCFEATIAVASRFDLSKPEIFNIAEKAYEFVTKATGEKPEGQPKGPQGK
jgi:hypothetical protein